MHNMFDCAVIGGEHAQRSTDCTDNTTKLSALAASALFMSCYGGADINGSSTLVRAVSLNAEGLRSSPFASLPPGSVLHLSYGEAIQQIEFDFLQAIEAARGYELLAACELPAELVDLCLEVSQPDCRDDTWDAVMYKRISSSWRHRQPELIWLDDKVAQVSKVAELLKSEPLHLPVLAEAVTGNAEQEEALRQALMDHAERGEAVVVKPRHGANSCFVALWPKPQEAERAKLLESLEEALHAEDRSWEKECWQLSQVTRGAILQPLYCILVPKKADAGPRGRDAPMELKVQVLFGCVVGATLNTHPAPLWVARSGIIQIWDFQELVARGQVRCKSLDRCYGRNLPAELLSRLQEVLTSSWPYIRDSSERICRTAGLDELRVDWLLGDARWGPRVGELTYMGAGSRISPPLSMRLARAWAAGHLCRLGRLSLQSRSEGQKLLWPPTAERGKKVAEKTCIVRITQQDGQASRESRSLVQT